MAKFWSKGLFYKEWKIASWMSVFLTGLLLIHPVFNIINRLALLKEELAQGVGEVELWGDWFGDYLIMENTWLIAGLFITVALITFLFSHDRQSQTGDLLASMPFTRQQVIGTKWLSGALAIAIPFGIVFLLLTVVYWVNKGVITASYSLIVQWVLLGYLFLLAFYSFLFFVQTVMGHHLLASIVGAICTLVPWYLVSGIPIFLNNIFDLSATHPIIQIMHMAQRYTWWPDLMKGSIEYLPPDWNTYYCFYTHYGLRVALLLFLTAVFCILAQRAFVKNSFERNGQLLMFQFLEPVLIWGFAVCFGLLIVLFFGLGFNSGALILSIYLAVGTAVGYWIAKKTVHYYQR